ncbi:hypothetical protein LGN19_32130 [Burkholderia sp. AU30198]|uniref:hypothetical protein n=1 Tax=Burkholderia sp. AU30198 TaxID=2879627 RepID=UPI001CF3BB1E|nr:hypothetical protein [Burkholderia sp. AU30198]
MRGEILRAVLADWVSRAHIEEKLNLRANAIAIKYLSTITADDLAHLEVFVVEEAPHAVFDQFDDAAIAVQLAREARLVEQQDFRHGRFDLAQPMSDAARLMQPLAPGAPSNVVLVMNDTCQKMACSGQSHGRSPWKTEPNVPVRHILRIWCDARELLRRNSRLESIAHVRPRHLLSTPGRTA